MDNIGKNTKQILKAFIIICTNCQTRQTDNHFCRGITFFTDFTDRNERLCRWKQLEKNNQPRIV